MPAEFMSPEAAAKLIELRQRNAMPPQEIRELKKEIEGRTRAAEVRMSVTGQIDEDEVAAIVQLKRRLDGLYAAWAEGKI